jgi:hypothetical protein
MRVRAAIVAALAGASSDCVRVDRSIARAILANPNRYYVNVHTAGLPDGAIRGQLFAKQR